MDSIEVMVEELNEYCERSLSVVHYSSWEVHSYHSGTLFVVQEINDSKKHIPKQDTFEEVIYEAYDLMLEDIKLKKESE